MPIVSDDMLITASGRGRDQLSRLLGSRVESKIVRFHLGTEKVAEVTPAISASRSGDRSVDTFHENPMFPRARVARLQPSLPRFGGSGLARWEV